MIKLFFIYSHKHFSDKIFLDCGNLSHNSLFLNLFFLHPPENQEFSYPDFRICVFQVPGKSQIFLDKKDLQLAISTNNTVFFTLFLSIIFVSIILFFIQKIFIPKNIITRFPAHKVRKLIIPHSLSERSQRFGKCNRTDNM